MKKGTRVIIIEDCRDNGTATGQEGIYEGRFAPYADDPSFTNPRIRLQDNSVIWGMECWWKPVDDTPLIDAQKDLLAHKIQILNLITGNKDTNA
jgi:hypothetical protein